MKRLLLTLALTAATATPALACKHLPAEDRYLVARFNATAYGVRDTWICGVWLRRIRTNGHNGLVVSGFYPGSAAKCKGLEFHGEFDWVGSMGLGKGRKSCKLVKQPPLIMGRPIDGFPVGKIKRKRIDLRWKTGNGQKIKMRIVKG